MEPKIIKEGNYSPSNHNASSIVNGEGIAPAVIENHGTVTAVKLPANTICLNSKVDGKHWKTVVGSKQMNSFRGSLENESPCITSACGAGGGMTPMVTNAELETTKTKEFIEQMRGYKPLDYRIRKLTPRECFRLMGVSEENIDKIQSAGISNSQQYKLAGNSIVVDVLYYIFKNLLCTTSDHINQTLFPAQDSHSQNTNE